MSRPSGRYPSQRRNSANQQGRNSANPHERQASGFAVPKAPPVIGLETRLAALRMLDGVMRQASSLERAAALATRKLAPEDRAHAIAIASEVLRWLRPLDEMIDSATQQNLPDDSKARMVLRIALAQAFRLNTPHHAVVGTALPLVDGGPRRLVHGVLSNLLREATLAEITALPKDVEARWRESWGDDAVAAAAIALSGPPPLDLHFKSDDAARIWAETHEGTLIMPRLVRIARGRPVEHLPEFAEGSFWIQDLAASLPARLLGNGASENGPLKVLDLCAAPGGKTMQLASNGWQVTALDLSGARLNRMAENLERTGISADLQQGDLTKWKPSGELDAILLDAPCSATGIFRRHPDVLARVGSFQIAELAEQQAAFLDRAAGWLKSGGVLVYAVCSLEPVEGEAQITEFLQRHPDFALESAGIMGLPDALKVSPEGWVRTGPWQMQDLGGLDGFFMAKLRKK